MTLHEIRQDIMQRVYGRQKSFDQQLCYELHEGGLTFDMLAAKWEISLPLLGVLIADHCYKLTAIVDDEVHTAEEYHERFDFALRQKDEG